MASLDQLKGTFFDECSEALQQIELGLSDLREGTASDDTINAVFRSVHSVKGGAGIFGFDNLVKFAHVFETVLDAMRSGKLPSSRTRSTRYCRRMTYSRISSACRAPARPFRRITAWNVAPCSSAS